MCRNEVLVIRTLEEYSINAWPALRQVVAPARFAMIEESGNAVACGMAVI
jgi:hypothetical protein